MLLNNLHSQIEWQFLSRIKTMNFLNNVRSWNKARQTRSQLNALSPRQLDDIGIARHQISSVARNPHQM